MAHRKVIRTTYDYLIEGGRHLVRHSSTVDENSSPLKSSKIPNRGHVWNGSYLVDPASSHMLVSKIKPCMSKYKQICTSETANGSLNQL